MNNYEMNQVFTAMLNNSCTCHEYTDGEPVEYCDGECWAMGKEDLTELLNTWNDRLLEAGLYIQGRVVVIIGRNISWQHYSGTKTVAFDADSVIDAMRLNGDFRLSFQLQGTELTAVRYSHDEPTGASFTFQLI